MSRDIYAAAEALQNARDHLVIGKSDALNRNQRVAMAIENIRDAMKSLGVKEAETNGN